MPRRGVFLVAALAITVEAAPLKPLARGFWDDGVSQPINPALASPPSPSPLPHVPTSPRRKPFETDDAGGTLRNRAGELVTLQNTPVSWDQNAGGEESDTANNNGDFHEDAPAAQVRAAPSCRSWRAVVERRRQFAIGCTWFMGGLRGPASSAAGAGGLQSPMGRLR